MVVKALELAGLHPGRDIRRQQRQRDGAVGVAHHRIGKLVRIHLAPADRLGRRGTAETARVRTRIGALQEVVVPLLLDAHDLLDLRLGLQHEILRTAAAQNEHAARVARALRVIHDARRLVHVAVHIGQEQRPAQGHRRHIHTDGTVTRAAGEDGDAALIGRCQDGTVPDAQLLLAGVHILAQQVVELVGAHHLLELRPLDDLTHEGVGVEQHVVVEEHIVDADDALIVQFHVIQERRPAVQVHVQTEVQVVVQVGTRRNDPVHIAALHQRDEAALAQAGRSEGTSQRQADEPVIGQHLLGEQLGRLAQPAAVVGQHRLIDEVGGRDALADGERVEPGVGGELLRDLVGGRFAHNDERSVPGNRK